MDSKNIPLSRDELRHWGIVGMKWGVRRYQNKDGSLTNAGKKRRAKLEAELEKLGDKSNGDAANKKNIKDLSDDELRERTNRLNLEKNYKDAVKAVGGEAKVGRGRRFANMFSDKLVDSFAEKSAHTVSDLGAQTLKSVGAKFLNQWLDSTFAGSAEKVYTNNKK